MEKYNRFQGKARQCQPFYKGMKKKKNEDGDKYYDEDEIYDLIYEFRDNLLSGDDTYLKVAPEWFN